MFADRLKVELKLTGASDTVEVPGADVKAFRIALRPWGFEAEATFWTALDHETDAVFSWFKELDLVKASLSVRGVLHLPTPAPEPLAVSGIVTEKAIFEQTVDVGTGTPIHFRRYRIKFADAVSVLWRQHFPVALYTDATMKDVIEAQKVSGIAFDYEWPVLETTRTVICLGLDGARSPASFYDFLAWYARSENGVWTYDAKTDKHKLAAAKSADGLPSILHASEVEHLDWVTPATIRHNQRVLSASSKEPKTEALTQDQAVAPVSRDFLMIAPVAARVDERKAVETARLVTENPGLEVEFSIFPKITLRPGLFVRLETGGWSTAIVPYMDEFRALEVEIDARAQNGSPGHDRGLKHTGYDVTMRARFELKADTTVRLPAFVPPEWPIFAEGRVVSEVPEDKERTFQVYPEAVTSLDMYKVNVPLWNKKVLAPFEPGLETGHFYFPPYRDQRVLVRLEFLAAWIARYLDWAKGARLPADTQGNHLLLGRGAESETSISVVYTDSKPVLTTKRTSGKDLQTITVKEGAMILEVKKIEAGAAAEPEFDVTVDVETAKGELRGQVGGSVTELTGAFATAEMGIGGEIGAATGEISNKLDGADSAISDEVNAATSELGDMKGQLGQGVTAVMGQAEEAKAALLAATR